jgi:hypothetical protein
MANGSVTGDFRSAERVLEDSTSEGETTCQKKQGSDGDYGGPVAVNIGINAGIKTGIEKDQHKEECDEYSNGVT